MVQLKKILLISSICLGLTACVTNKEATKPHFIVSTQQTIAAPPADKAQIIILQPINSIQGLFPVGIFELKDNQRTMLATTGAHTKAVLLLSPGEHMLMSSVLGGANHLMLANVEAGKRYYVLSRFIYANGFQLRPLRTTADSSNYSILNKDFNAWVNGTQLVSMTPESISFYETRVKERADKNQANVLEKWQRKSNEERAELTLRPEDAVKDY